MAKRITERGIRVIELMKQGFSGKEAYQRVFTGVNDNVAMSKASQLLKKYKDIYGSMAMIDVAKKAVKVGQLAKHEQNTSKSASKVEQNSTMQKKPPVSEALRKEVTESINKITRLGINVDEAFDFARRKQLAIDLIEKSISQFVLGTKEAYTPDLLLRYSKRDSDGNEIDFSERRQIPLAKDILAMIGEYERVYGAVERTTEGDGNKKIEILLTRTENG